MTTKVIVELDSLIALVEGTIPANPNAPANQRKAKALERELAKYFNKLEQAFPFGAVERFYNKKVKE